MLPERLPSLSRSGYPRSVSTLPNCSRIVAGPGAPCDTPTNRPDSNSAATMAPMPMPCIRERMVVLPSVTPPWDHGGTMDDRAEVPLESLARLAQDLGVQAEQESRCKYVTHSSSVNARVT